jgi:hypothetical protein
MLGGLALVDAGWAGVIGFHLIVTWHNGMMLGATLAAALVVRKFSRRGAMFLEFLALTLLSAMVFGVMSYLCLASSGHLVDSALLRIDRAMGFDWLAGFHFLQAHPTADTWLRLLYNSMPYQALYVAALLGVMGRKAILRETFWVVAIAGLLTNIGVMLFPALGPFEQFGLQAHGAFLPEMKKLLAGNDLTFSLAHLTGVVCFPSFHTAMAIIYTRALRGTGAVGWSVAAANAVMLLSIPFIGGHYLIDMIAGAGVVAVSVLIVSRFVKADGAPSVASVSPESVAESGGAYSGAALSR